MSSGLIDFVPSNFWDEAYDLPETPQKFSPALTSPFDPHSPPSDPAAPFSHLPCFSSIDFLYEDFSTVPNSSLNPTPTSFESSWEGPFLRNQDRPKPQQNSPSSPRSEISFFSESLDDLDDAVCADEANETEFQPSRHYCPVTECSLSYKSVCIIILILIPSPPCSVSLSSSFPSVFSLLLSPFPLTINVRRRGDLNAHIKKKHQVKEGGDGEKHGRMSKIGKPFPCCFPDCPSGFMRTGDLRRHYYQKHGDLPNIFE